MYIPRHFTPKELFPPELLKTNYGMVFDPRQWRRFDERILMSFDDIREDHGPITGNEGNLTGCGFRFPVIESLPVSFMYDIEALSQHTFGRAIDGHPKEKTSFEIRKEIILNPSRYPHIRFLEIDISWLHGDCRNVSYRNHKTPVIKLWSIDRGFVSIDEYLKWGDK